MRRSRARAAMARGAMLVSLLAATACGNDGAVDPGPPPPPPPPAIPLAAQQSSHLPLSIAVVTVPAGVVLGNTSYTGRFDNVEVNLARVGDNALALLLPERPAGVYALTVSLGTRTGTATLTMAAAPAIPDPAAFLVANVERVRSAAAQSTAGMAESGRWSAAQIEEVGARARALADQVAALSAAATDAERREAALFVAANPELFAPATESTGPSRAAAPDERCPPGIDPEVRYQMIKAFIANQVSQASPVLTFRQVRESGGTRWDALKSALVSLNIFGRVMNIGKEVSLGALCIVGRAGEMIMEEINGSNSREPVSGPSRSASTATPGTVFPNTIARAVRVTSMYRSLAVEDAQWDAQLGAALGTLQDVTVWAAQFFGVSALGGPLLSAQPRTERAQVNAAYLTARLNASTPAGVSLSYAPQGKDLLITLTSDREREVLLDLLYAPPGGTPGMTSVPALVATFRVSSPRGVVRDSLRYTPTGTQYYTLTNADGSTAQAIDYTAIAVTGSTNAAVTVTVVRLAAGFGLKIDWRPAQVTRALQSTGTSFDVTYRGRMVQRLNVAVVDSTGIYEAAALGRWRVSTDASSYVFDVTDTPARFAGLPWRTGQYRVPPPPGQSCATREAVRDGPDCLYLSSWHIFIRDGRYHFEDIGFWHSGFDGGRHEPLSIPITSFRTYSRFVPSQVSRTYQKM